MMMWIMRWFGGHPSKGTLVMGCLVAMSGSAAHGQDAVNQWIDGEGPWIKVGLKQPVETPRFRIYGPAWLLDGKKPVARIEPRSAFWVVVDRHADSAYWVQVQAAGSVAVLRTTQTRISGKTGVTAHRILPRPNSRLKVLQFGPYAVKQDAERFRATAVGLGFSDAFMVRDRGTYPMFWVDDQFDKHPIGAAQPGIVSENPETQITFNGTEYRGILHFRKTGNRIRVINELPLETYLRGVVPAEMGPYVFPELEALKAQAIAARTYALKNMGRFARDGYDICDSPACQAYGGYAAEHPMSDEAVRSTEGLVLTHDGELIDALYTSTCGGHTEDVANVFPGRSEPYLKGKSSYVPGLQAWKLPPRPIPAGATRANDAPVLVQALLFGFERLPGLDGALKAEDIKQWMGWLDWIWGSNPEQLSEKDVTWNAFYVYLAGFELLCDAIDHQLDPRDVDRLTRGMNPPPNTARLTALLQRFGLLSPDLWVTLQQPGERVDKRPALAILMQLTQAFGPSLTWKTFKVEYLDGANLVVSRSGEERLFNLADIRYYLIEEGDSLMFAPDALLEELDLVELPQFPFDAPVLKIKPRGTVASMDRFSTYDAWMEKRSIEEIEDRAAQYIRGISGIQDIRVLERSPTGRVTLLEFVARSGRHRVDGLRIRWSLGIRDNFFDVKPFHREGKLVGAIFFGRGWGHGVGMSQVGAFGLARLGWSYQKILNFYYTDVKIGALK